MTKRCCLVLLFFMPVTAVCAAPQPEMTVLQKLVRQALPLHYNSFSRDYRANIHEELSKSYYAKATELKKIKGTRRERARMKMLMNQHQKIAFALRALDNDSGL